MGERGHGLLINDWKQAAVVVSYMMAYNERTTAIPKRMTHAYKLRRL